MNKTLGGTAGGAAGALVHKMILPALDAMAKRGVLDVPVIGAAFSNWSLAQLRQFLSRADLEPQLRRIAGNC